ncbi:MAG: DUF362 domain-containing protein [Desulfobacterales bacterium]|jgi:uncharacterized protein (DUF362 family)/ferredoxin
MARVALVRCENYHYQTVRAAVEKGINLLGGPGKFAQNGERVLLKPNLLAAESPRKCVTTHPSVFRAAAEVLLSTGAQINYGDSPALGNIAATINKTGFKEIAVALGVELADFKAGQEVFFREGRQNKKFILAKGITQSEGVISLPKLKTHGFERITGCVKNQFGCVPGLLKGEYHVKLPDANDFAKMLVDLTRLVNPRLYIMDGIQAMEGNGPRGGTPKNMNILLFSEDPVAVDATVCRLIDIKPEYVPTVKFGMTFGAGTCLESEIELLGDNFEGFKPRSFKAVRTPVKPYTKKGLLRFISNRLVPKPLISPDHCLQCGVCVSVCPVKPKALNWFNDDKSRPPVYQYNNCIRCYCCQEMCPEGAIRLKIPLIRKVFDYTLIR